MGDCLFSVRKGSIKVSQEQNDPAFEIGEVNLQTGKTTVIIQKGLLGALSNQLCRTGSQQKCSTILRKLGFVLKDCGDAQYGHDVPVGLDPNKIVNP